MAAMPPGWILPALTPWNEAWFTTGTIAIQCCTECDTRQHPPEETCFACGGQVFTTAVLAPTGTVHSYTVAHYAATPALRDSVPYVVVLVALDDAPDLRVVGNLDAPVAEVRIGLPVEAYWEEHAVDGTVLRLPQWRPVGEVVIDVR